MGQSNSTSEIQIPTKELDLRIRSMESFTVKPLYYGQKLSNGLRYSDKVPDFHRSRWETGDWTDDTDQMLAILHSLIDNEGQVVPNDVGKKFVNWMKHGIAEHGDVRGMGIGGTTSTVLRHPRYESEPHECAFEVWDSSGRNLAPNGAVMRTSVLGIHEFKTLNKVIENAVSVCKTTHADPRCIASCVAVTVAISVMLSRDDRFLDSRGCFNVDSIINFAFEKGCEHLDNEEHKEEFKAALFAKDLKSLQLTEPGKIGYTFKTLGAGFWAFKQSNFRKALQQVVMEGGDADTNGAVAGAMLGCKIGKSNIPSIWVDELKHEEWLDTQTQK
eukprot:gene16789-18484_t